MGTLMFAGAAAALALGAAAPISDPAADPRDAARVRQTVLAVPVNADLGAFDALQPLFADPVVVDYVSLWGGEPQALTPAGLLEAWCSVLPGFDATWHEVGDVQVSIAGDQARAQAAVDARHWLGAETWRIVGRYAFELTRAGDGRWRITHMTLTVTDEQGDRALVEQARARLAD
jgi:ketosteroid isomerase-like protein